MALTYSEPVALGATAPDFSLRGVDGKNYSLADFSGKRALVIVFMCNHCPYVQAVQGRINQLAKDFLGREVGVIGINPNDAVKYPDDSFESMKLRAKELGYVFPYLCDESQAVARAYGAVCTPDFFVFAKSGAEFILKYRGRLDDHWKDEASVRRRDLASALDAILAGRDPGPDQIPSMGCSIKWK